MKISIIGNCGSGKTTLASKISEKLRVPHLQLDRLWFEAGGKEATHRMRGTARYEEVRNKMREKIETVTQGPAWVSDGWYKRLQPMITERADILLFLDIPLWRRLLNHVKRMLFTNRHQELSKWDDVKFIFEIIQRTFTHDPAMRVFVVEHQDKAIVLRSYTEMDHYLGCLR